MHRRQTALEARLGPPPGSDALVALWDLTLVNNLLRLVWQAYSDMYSAIWSQDDWTQDHDDEERLLSEELERAIQRAGDGFLPEAKVLDSDRNTNENLGNYVETVQDRYLTCYYAPFSNSGAMLGYMKSGSPEVVVQHIARRMGVALATYNAFPAHCHKTSDHWRPVPAGKDYPAEFRLHHLIMPL